MKLFFILSFSLLPLIITSGSLKTRSDEECGVKQKQVLNFEDIDSHNALVFMDGNNTLSIQISFMNLILSRYNDLLIFKTNSGEVQRKRNGVTTTFDIELKHDISQGWNNMNITVQDNRLDIGSFYSLTDLEHTIQDVYIFAKHVTACVKRNAIWKIDGNEDCTIPLNGLSHLRIELTSDGPFQPVFTLNNISIPLYFHDELFVRSSVQPLPAENYQFIVEKNTDMLSIFTLSTPDECKLLMSIKTNEDLMDLKVNTLSGNFFLTINPFPEDQFEAKSTTTKSGKFETTNATPAMEAVQDCSASSSPITTVLVSVIAMISFIINISFCLTNSRIMRFLKRRCTLGGSGENNMEIGVATISQLAHKQQENMTVDMWLKLLMASVKGMERYKAQITDKSTNATKQFFQQNDTLAVGLIRNIIHEAGLTESVKKDLINSGTTIEDHPMVGVTEPDDKNGDEDISEQDNEQKQLLPPALVNPESSNGTLALESFRNIKDEAGLIDSVVTDQIYSGNTLEDHPMVDVTKSDDKNKDEDISEQENEQTQLLPPVSVDLKSPMEDNIGAEFTMLSTTSLVPFDVDQSSNAEEVYYLRPQCDYIRTVVIIYMTTYPNATADHLLAKGLWEKLKCNVVSIKDPTIDDVSIKLEHLRNEINGEPDNYDMLAVMYIGPGGRKSKEVYGKLYTQEFITLANNGHMHVDNLCENFLPSNCPGMAGKPKVQILHVFEGLNEKRRGKIRGHAASDLSENSDFYFLHSWFKEDGSKVDELSKESEFITTLHKVFTRDCHLLDIASMSKAIRREMQDKTQTVDQKSTLVKRLCFQSDK